MYERASKARKIKNFKTEKLMQGTMEMWQIQKAIQRLVHLLFLVSPHSVSEFRRNFKLRTFVIAAFSFVIKNGARNENTGSTPSARMKHDGHTAGE